MLAEIVIIGGLLPVAIGIGGPLVVWKSARQPARRAGHQGRQMRAGMVWWLFGVLIGVIIPLTFILLMLDFAARTPGAAPSLSGYVAAAVFALGGWVLLGYAVRYRVYFDGDRVEARTLFRGQRMLSWSNITSVRWLPRSARLLLHDGDTAHDIRIGMESGFLDFVAALEHHVPAAILGDAPGKARQSVRR